MYRKQIKGGNVTTDRHYSTFSYVLKKGIRVKPLTKITSCMKYFTSESLFFYLTNEKIRVLQDK